MPVYMAGIILCGLVINVNIVMVYTINSLLKGGAPLETAVWGGVERRLRPILMTVSAAVCGSLPMLFDRGTGSWLWAPFALTLAAGTTVSAIFSLLVTPMLYKALERLKQRVQGLLSAP
jgi:cobalt-zinc-cadmium resistance protein CzcA